jgi:hypothetical protein
VEEVSEENEALVRRYLEAIDDNDGGAIGTFSTSFSLPTSSATAGFRRALLPTARA